MEPLSERLRQKLNDLSKVTQKGGESNGWSGENGENDPIKSGERTFVTDTRLKICWKSQFQ